MCSLRFTDSQNWLREIVWQQREREREREKAYSNREEKYFAAPRISAGVVNWYIVRDCIRGKNERSVLFCSAWNFPQTFAFVFLWIRTGFKRPSLLKRPASINFASVNYKLVCTPSQLWFIKTDSFLARRSTKRQFPRSSSRWRKEPGQLCCCLSSVYCSIFFLLPV